MAYSQLWQLILFCVFNILQVCVNHNTKRWKGSSFDFLELAELKYVVNFRITQVLTESMHSLVDHCLPSRKA